MNEGPEMSPEELAAILLREYDAADDYHDQLDGLQEAAFRYYEAQPFGNEVEGRSQIVLPDVQETCDYMGQSVLRTFVSGDRTVEFEAVNEEDEQAADDATAAIDFRFMREQDGYGVLNDVTQDGNLKMIGVFKALCEEEEKVSREWQVIPPEALGMIDDGEIENVREIEEQDEQGQPIPMLRVLIKRQETERCHKIVAVPTDEFRFSPMAKHEDTAGYVAHVRKITRSDLVGMGFDAEQVYELPTHSDWEDIESDTLDYHTGETSSEALEEVLLCEEYARIDVDGDGIAERVKCFRVENTILMWAGEEGQEGELAVETVDEQPFSVFCPFPRAHRLVGYSLASKVMDVQLARSEIARQLMDGMAYANMPRHEVSENEASDETLDDLLNPFPGSPVRSKTGNAVKVLSSSFDVGKSLSVMEWMTGERESRTGITRMNQGLDADAMNKTATGTALMQSQGQQFEEYIARNLAEAFSRACGKLYRMMRVEAEPFTIQVDGKYREVDPSQWPERVNLRIRVGLGTNAKDKRIQARMALQEPLVLLKQEGLAGAEHVYNWLDGLTRDMGIGQGEDYMYNPDDPEVQQRMQQQEQQPDPEVMAKQAEMQAKQEEAQARLQLDAQKAQASAQLDREKAAADIETQREKHAMDMQVARERAALEQQLAREKTYAEIELAREKTGAEMQLKKSQADANMTDQRMGGSVAS